MKYIDFLSKNISYKKFKIYFVFLMFLFLINNAKAYGFERKKYLLDHVEVENIYFQTSIPFGEYDNFKNQLKNFLGLYSLTSDKNYFPDIMIINETSDIRQLYNSKLNDMTFNKNSYMIKSK